ncbi:MAG TPA: DUF1080 domain-containing protein [Bryobacteraceae bacterium]|jgi:hypothetical protein|nr:DUF1080 domain-containing protein [Bryobacteraceae bacterium]
MIRHFALLAALLTSQAGTAENLKPIFDGKTLNGWRQCNGSARYSVENGELVGVTAKGSPNSFLCTEKEYGDFILEFEVKVDPALNSGVQIRSHRYEKATTVMTENKGKKKRTHEAGRVHGYQVEIANEKSGASGGIYDEAGRGWVANVSGDPAASKAFHDNQWNQFRVVAMGDSIKTWINGVPCADLVDSAELTGFLALQVHQFPGESPAQVRWRNIRLEDLGKSKWHPLWDGRTKTGWTQFGGGQWTIVEGALRGVSPKDSTERGFLLTENDFADFTVRLKYKAVKGNSGFFFRMADPNAPPSGPVGYEVEVDPSRDAGGLLEPRGRQWIFKPSAEKAGEYYKADDWNELVVSAHGGRVVLHLNGEKTADLANDPGRRIGRLALQINPRQELEVRFKDIEALAK